MGLLNRASNANLNEHAPSEPEIILDEMGKALRERIGRLDADTGRPYTVLSLLKAYSSFQTGICFYLKDTTYSSITSLGMDTEKVSIPVKNIWSEAKAGLNYFKLLPDEKTGITIAEEGFNYWVFPLRKSEASSVQPWDGIMILGIAAGSADANSAFDPGPISAILSGNTDKIVVKPAEKPVLDAAQTEVISAAGEDAEFPEYNSAEDFIKEQNRPRDSLKEKIAQYHLSHNDFNCIIMEIPGSAPTGEKAAFCRRVTDMISMAGTVIPLSSGSPLILLPSGVDRELIAHRLSSSFNTKPIFSFEANDPESVCEKISSLL